MAGALDGVRVLDLSRVLAGPWATQILADLGAEVIKVERPGEGDDTRAWGPPFVGEGEERQSAYFLSANRGKRSICIDLAAPEGQGIVRRLAQRADVVVENFKVGALARYGLDWENLSLLNPRLVYCSITGFGQEGPHAQRPGYDFLIQAMGGLMSVTGAPDGPPMKAGVALVDILTGLYACNGVQAALRHRDRTGQGQRIDIALLDCLMASMANQALSTLVTGQDPPRLGNAHPSIAPYDVFPGADGHLILAVGNDGQFARLCQVLGAPELASEPAFATNAARAVNRPALSERLNALLAERTCADWLARLEAANVPAGPINGLNAAFDDPQARARGLRIEVPHATLGTASGVASPLRLSATPPAYERGPPALGQDTGEVLGEILGLDAAEIAALFINGVVAGTR